MNDVLIPAVLKDKELRQEINDCLHISREDTFDIWWLGQSGFLIQWNGHTVLLDPYLSDSLTQKYAGTNKPHVRMSERVIDPSLLDRINVVTSSHNHTDHLDAETLIPLLAANPGIRFLIPEANRDFVCDRVKCPTSFPTGLNDGESVVIHPFTFHGLPAAHNEIERDQAGRCKYMSYVIQFGPFTVYHSGDTLLYENLVSLLDPFSIDVALLPINGNLPERGVAGNMNAEEAAAFGKEIGARLVIPHHYHMFAFNTANPEDFKRAAIRVDQPYKIPAPGERVQFAL